MNFTMEALLGELPGIPDAADAAEQELVSLARQIRDWQDGRKPRISDEQLVRTYSGLGSTKTYRRLRDGDTSSLVIESQLAKYRGVWAQIEVAGNFLGEEIYPDLTPTFACSVSIAGLIPQRGKTRLVVIEGPTGSGKTTALDVIAAKYAGTVARTEAHEGWQSLNCALGDILASLGMASADQPKSTADRLALITGTLRRSRRLVLIDEGHHCTAPVLNALKTILNLTDSLIVIAGIDTLWRKLTARSWEEARQLIHNRLYERVRLAPPSQGDVELFLGRRVPALNGGNWKQAAGKVAAMSAHLGSYAFLRRIGDKLAAEGGEPDATTILEAAADLKSNLETR